MCVGGGVAFGGDYIVGGYVFLAVPHYGRRGGGVQLGQTGGGGIDSSDGGEIDKTYMVGGEEWFICSCFCLFLRLEP